MKRLAAAAVLLLAAACGPTAPKGVDQAVLDDAVAGAIGDPSTCLMIAETPSGRLVYRYGSNVTCGRMLPSCLTPGQLQVRTALKATVKTGLAMKASCPSANGGVGWAAGPAGPGLAYAAAMEGQRALPGLVMADRIAGAFKRAGVTH